MNGQIKTSELGATISNVMQPSDAAATAKRIEENHENEIRGYDLNNGLDYEKLLQSYLNTGFQATNFGKAVNEINRMVFIYIILVISFKQFKIIIN